MSQIDEEVVGTITPDEEPELDLELEDTEDVEVLKEQLEKEREARRQLTARAKKAETENKELKTKISEPVKPTQTETSINNPLTPAAIDERVLKAQGMDDELLDKLKKVAQVTGKTLIEAQSDELFVAFKDKFEERVKADKAKLGASRGSSSVRKEKTFSTPGLSSTEHKEMWRKSQGLA